MSRLDVARQIRVFRRIMSAREIEREKDACPVYRRVLRHVQRQRRKNWEQGSWASYKKVHQAVFGHVKGMLTSYDFYMGQEFAGSGDWV